MRTVCSTHIILLSLLALALAACGSNGSHDKPPATAEPGLSSGNSENTPLPATVSPAAVHLQRAYESLRESHQKISDIWEGLATGEQVRCGEYPEVLSPETITSEGDTTYEPLAALLHSAAIDIGQAINLWKAECTNTRTNPPSDVIDRGRLAVRSAGDALNQAQELLAGIQG
jgi:predicted small lipoprotein YifL